MKNTFTYKEIFLQPSMWFKEFSVLKDSKADIINFFKTNNINKNTRIVFTGAGTSAFIGNILEVLYYKHGYINTASIPTTDIVSHPKAYFSKGEKVVLVSFARSGNSPESMSTVDLVNRICGNNVLHVVITCNKEGSLAKNIDKKDLLLLLPPETNDRGLAMTSSFSTMLLAGYILTQIEELESLENSISMLTANAKDVLDKLEKEIPSITKLKFTRAVFLGSAELKGVAEECQLKLQELTDGKVLCKHDSFLGFRHGPKAILDENTLVVYLLSEDKHALLYEIDLIKQINSNNKLIAQIVVSQDKIEIENLNFDLEILVERNKLSFMIYAFIGQMLGFFKSLDMGLNPDSPAVSGNIARVVEGVQIYEHPTI